MSTVSYVDNIPTKLELTVKAGERLSLEMAAFKTLKDTHIEVVVEEGGYFNGVLADFSDSSFRFSMNVRLKGYASSCDWHLASLCGKDNKKVFESNVIHEGIGQHSLMSNYGISKDEGHLTFGGYSEILKKCSKADVRQESKIILFDKKCGGKASPILKIAENDVNASHGAIVGRLNDSHLFYLESRGIDEETAKRLITLGYLRPIVDHFEHEATKKLISDVIEGAI